MVRRILFLIVTFAMAQMAFAMAQMAYAHETPSGFEELTARLAPAVVNISTAQTVDISDEQRAFPKGSPLERFNEFLGGGEENRIAKSLGSGFVIDEGGYIVTNNHVIEGADAIDVAFPNGDSYEARLIGRDPSTDIAVLKIDAEKKIPFVKFAGADSAKVGEWVIAIGNPLGYSSSVAAGIVSARNRNISMGNYDDFIQTDVAINKGNSGGPLFNMAGEVVGVNTAIVSPTGFSVGLSFSIPADLAATVVSQLREFGETRRGYLGVATQAVDKGIAKAYRLDGTYGAVVSRVSKDSPAAKAGLKRGDLIVSLGGVKLETSRRLARMVADAEIDAPLEIEFIRKRKKKTVSAIIERLKEKSYKPKAASENSDDGLSAESAMGITVTALDDRMRRRLRLEDTPAVRISKINKRSEAYGKLKKGDIVLEISHEPIGSPDAFVEQMEAASKDDVPIIILVTRGGRPIFHTLAPES